MQKSFQSLKLKASLKEAKNIQTQFNHSNTAEREISNDNFLLDMKKNISVRFRTNFAMQLQSSEAWEFGGAHYILSLMKSPNCQKQTMK